MLGQPSLALAILGLGAVHGLPTQNQPVEERAPQTFGPPSSSFGLGDLTSGSEIACNPLTDESCSWWPEITSPPTENGDRISFGPIHPRDLDAIEKIKRSSVDDLKREIIDIERRITALQNLDDKSWDEKDELRWLRRELERLTGIVKIVAPPGVVTTFTPGKRYAAEHAKRSSVDDLKREIIDIEHRITYLQNLEDKSREDREELRWLRRELERLSGVVKIIAPPGTETTFTPGKRDTTDAPQLKKRQGLIFPGPGAAGSYAGSDCPSLNDAARTLDRLLSAIDHDRLPRWAENMAVQVYERFLDGCGMGIDQYEDDQGVILEVYRKDDHEHSDGRRLWPKRSADEEAKFDTAGLREARHVLLETLGGAEPTIATWMVLKTIEAELAAQGEVVKRQSSGSGDTFKLGEGACQLADILALKAALAALGLTYGNDRSRIPPSVFLVEQIIVSALQICNQPVAGWTTITPGNPIPGGPIVPGQPIPGGAVVPGQPIGGGTIVPGQPVGGGTIVPGQPVGGGSIVPGQPSGGGRIEPQRPGDGGRMNPERPEGGRITGEQPVEGGAAKAGCRLEECWQ